MEYSTRIDTYVKFNNWRIELCQGHWLELITEELIIYYYVLRIFTDLTKTGGKGHPSKNIYILNLF